MVTNKKKELTADNYIEKYLNMMCYLPKYDEDEIEYKNKDLKEMKELKNKIFALGTSPRIKFEMAVMHAIGDFKCEDKNIFTKQNMTNAIKYILENGSAQDIKDTYEIYLAINCVPEFRDYKIDEKLFGKAIANTNDVNVNFIWAESYPELAFEENKKVLLNAVLVSENAKDAIQIVKLHVMKSIKLTREEMAKLDKIIAKSNNARNSYEFMEAKGRANKKHVDIIKSSRDKKTKEYFEEAKELGNIR